MRADAQSDTKSNEVKAVTFDKLEGILLDVALQEAVLHLNMRDRYIRELLQLQLDVDIFGNYSFSACDS